MIDLSYALLSQEPSIIYIKFKPDAQIGFLEIRELVKYADMLSDGKPYFTFCDARKRINITPLGKRLAMDVSEAPLHRGTAVLVTPEMIAVAANLFGRFIKPPYPYRAFTLHEQAIQWVKYMAAALEVNSAGVRTQAMGF